MRAVLAVSLLLALAGSACSAQSIDLQLQHSLDGGRSFVKAGSISGQGQDVELLRTSAPAAADLNTLVQNDGFYVVRVPTGKEGRFVSASVRAACLAANPSTEQLHVALDDTGAVLSLSYSLEGVKAAACKASASPALPERSTVSVQRPSEGPSVLTPQALGVFEQGVFTGEGAGPGASARSREAPGSGPTGRPRGVVNRQPGAAADGADGDGPGPDAEGMPPPEEKTWLQKNWLMVLGVSMAVMNLVGNLGRAQQGTPGAPAGAAAAGGGGGGARAGGARRG